VIIVSSGAVGVGCQRLGLTQRPNTIAKKQALAAVGQVHLMRYYEDFLSALGLVRGLLGCAPHTDHKLLCLVCGCKVATPLSRVLSKPSKRSLIRINRACSLLLRVVHSGALKSCSL
jgi:hypothetical protein